jgi:hypothetical protein
MFLRIKRSKWNENHTCTCIQLNYSFNIFLKKFWLHSMNLFSHKLPLNHLNNDQFFFISKYIIFIIYYVRKDGIPPQAQVSEVDQFDYTLWICLVINSLWITFHVSLWLFQFGGWGYVNMNLVIFHLHIHFIYLPGGDSFI